MIDARRMEVYYNQYDYLLKEAGKTDNLVLNEESISIFSAESVLFCGDGAYKMQDFLQAKWQIRLKASKHYEKHKVLVLATFLSITWFWYVI